MVDKKGQGSEKFDVLHDPTHPMQSSPGECLLSSGSKFYQSKIEDNTLKVDCEDSDEDDNNIDASKVSRPNKKVQELTFPEYI